MVFSSPIFVFFFLPLTLLFYFAPRIFLREKSGLRWENGVLIAASIIFYYWGEGPYVLVMLGCITFNWIGSLLIERYTNRRDLILYLGVAGNLLFLGWFKYAGFIFANFIEPLPGGERLRPFLTGIHMPIGISFFTFQAMSYLIDVYRGSVMIERNWLKLCLYKSFFPQLIAGPIVRYRDISPELYKREHSAANFAAGARRFICGFAQKVILANTMGAVADKLFSLPPSQLTTVLAWIAAVTYTFQIYFDFCGYSNMAIGLARIFGFHFLENFNYPYVAQSVTDFWRRWHISLSTWFRDYLYIPLGGSREGELKTYRNLIIVFFLCGLWHGAEWHFVAWGMYHGMFLVLERARLGVALFGARRIVRHVYTLIVVIFGWVLFRADTFSQAGAIAGKMLGIGAVENPPLLREVISPEAAAFAVLAALFSTPVLQQFGRIKPAENGSADYEPSFVWLCAHLCIFFIALGYLADGSFNPFIYFRF